MTSFLKFGFFEKRGNILVLCFIEDGKREEDSNFFFFFFFSSRSKFSKVVKLEFKKRVRWKNQYRQEERNYPFDIVERVMSRRNERGGIRKREFCVIIRV